MITRNGHEQELHSNATPPVFNPVSELSQLSTAHWHVLGAGAMGCLFGAALQASGNPVTLLLRRDHPQPRAELRLDTEKASRQLLLPVSHCADTAAISHLLVTTKAYDVRSAVTAVAHRLGPDSQVLLLVNGMGFTQPLQRDFPWLDIFHGTTTEGAFRVAPWHVRHAGKGQTRLGQLGRADPPGWFRQWAEALDECEWDAGIDEALWLKLAINCAINPLTAVHGCSNGELARRPELAAHVDRLCTEIAQVCEAAGHASVANRVRQVVAQVIAGTAQNRSSMLQDVEAGRPTEIDHITGFLLAEANQRGIDVPVNAALLEGVRRLAA